MNSEHKLNIKVEASNVQNTISSLNQLEKTLTGMSEKFVSLRTNTDLSKTLKTTTTQMGKLATVTRKFDKEGNLKYTNSIIKEMTNSTGALKQAFTSVAQSVSKVAIAVAMLKSAYTTLKSLVDESIDYSEALNLFNVAFDNTEKNGKTMFSTLGKEATEFQNKLKNNFGANTEESMTYQALYQSMAGSQGLDDEAASIMSENTTKLIYDLASLYNKEEEDVAEALRAGIYAGQTKPLRSYGLDITETSLQATLDKLKETNSELKDMSVSTMSQGEKEILRYITVLQQASVAQGDYANTIESPANQMKVLRNELAMTAASIGNLFVKPFQKLLQYANAILIVIRYVANAIADAFGIEASDYNTSIASASDYSDSLDDVADSATDASNKVSALKRQTLGFDQINNISTSSSSSSSSSSSGGISQALVDSLSDYENGLDKVKLKAESIAESIMKWLGFEKEIDPLTGEISYKFTGFKTLIKNVVDWFNNLSIIAKLAIIAVIGKGVASAITKFKSLITLVKGTSTSFSEWSSSINKVKVGLGLVLVSIVGITDSVSKMADHGTSLGKTVEFIGSELTSIAGGFMMGGPLGAVAGALISYISTYETMYVQLKEIQQTTEEWAVDSAQRFHDAGVAADVYNEALTDINNSLLNTKQNNEFAIQLVDSLGHLIDANGKVTGSETEVQASLDLLNDTLGTNYKIVDGVVTNNGKEKVSYDELKKSVQKYCDELEFKITLEAWEEKAKEAIKQKISLTATLKEEQEKLNRQYAIIKQDEQERNELLEKCNGDILNLSESDRNRYRELGNNLDMEKRAYELLEAQIGKHTTEIQGYQDIIDDYTKANVLNAQGYQEEAMSVLDGTYYTNVNNLKKFSQETITNINSTLSKLNPKFSIQTLVDTTQFDNFITKLSKNNLYKPLAYALSKFKVNYMQSYATGGFPEDGLFYANHGELVGKFSNGKTAVANNAQITEGIKRAVMQGMAQAYATTGSEVKLNITTEEGIIVKKAINGINKITQTTGESPLWG